MDCVVIGAGVSGLLQSVLEAGHNVRVMARKFSPELVRVAAALWYPFLAHPVEKTDRWAAKLTLN